MERIDEDFKIMSSDEVMKLPLKERIEHDKKAFKLTREILGKSGFAMNILPEGSDLHTNHLLNVLLARETLNEIVNRNLVLLKEQNPLAMLDLVERALNGDQVSIGGLSIGGKKVRLDVK